MCISTSHFRSFDATIRHDYQLISPVFAVSSAEEAHIAAQKACDELKQKLSATEADKQNQCLKMTAEIDDLNRTKTNLEERLIELIRCDLLFVFSLVCLLSSTFSHSDGACSLAVPLGSGC